MYSLILDKVKNTEMEWRLDKADHLCSELQKTNRKVQTDNEDLKNALRQEREITKLYKEKYNRFEAVFFF